ncbi:MAG: response regulator [Hyphomonadaceae bacterium]
MSADRREAMADGPSYEQVRRRIIVFGAFFALFVVGAATLGFAQFRDNALEAASRRAHSYSHVLSAHLERLIGAVDARLTQIASQSEALGGPGGPRRPWNTLLEAARAGSASVDSITVFDRTGVARQSTRAEVIGLNRGDGLLVQALQTDRAFDFLSDAPFQSPFTQQWLLPYGRGIRGSNGGAVGTVVATVSPEALRAFYSTIDTEGGAIRVMHSSGSLVLEEPAMQGAALSQDDVVLRAWRDGRTSGAFAGPIRAGGPRMLTSFAEIAGGDLLVSVSLREDQALRSWRNDALAAGLILAGVLVAFAFASASIVAQLRAREAAERALAEQEHRLAQTQRLEAIGQLTGGVAHDFNNLLTVILNSADSAMLRASAEVQPMLQSVIQAAENGAALVRQLLAYSRRQPLSVAPLDVNEIVRSMEDMLKRTLGAQIEIAFALAPNLRPAFADRAQVESAVLNLAINARDAMPEGGRLTIETGNAILDADYVSLNPDAPTGEFVMLVVSDSGLGMSPEVAERALEPFFTTKDVGKGSGLGLSMIYGFAKQSKGHLRLYSEPGAGTTVRLYLPQHANQTAAPAPAAPGRAHAGGDEAVLVVEDEAQVRHFAAQALRERGYRVTEAGNGAEALALLDQDAACDVLFTDIMMPGMSGRELADVVRQRKPSVRVLFTSGYGDASVTRNGWLEPGARFLSKPYRAGELAAAMRALIEG